ncbi:hypothetical protein V8E52_004570 [Russula decolorans]
MNENNWNVNVNESYAAGSYPEYGPRAIFGASGVYTSSASASATGSPSPTPPPKGSIPNAGAIPGGVIGGIAAISFTVTAAFLYLRRRPRAPSAEYVGTGASQPHMDDASRPLSDGGTLSGSPVTIRFYTRMTQLLSWGNLAQPPDMFHQVSTSSQIRPGNTLAAWPPRRPLPRTQGLSRLSHACLITAFEANRVARVWDGSHCFFLLSPNAIGSGVIFSLGYYRCPARTGQNLRPLRDRDVLYVHHFLTPIQHSQALTSSL